MSATTIGSIWVDGAGCTVPANDTEGLRSQDDRIDAVEDVAAALFREWEAELGEYSNAELRRSS